MWLTVKKEIPSVITLVCKEGVIYVKRYTIAMLPMTKGEKKTFVGFVRVVKAWR
jgi:hypothetical protein